MALKKICRLLFTTLFLMTSISSFAEFSPSIKHILQIKTDLSYIEGRPTWLIEIRDLKSGRVLPYIYDFDNYDNRWMAFSTERAYRITNSSLKFGPQVVIHNFCGLESRVLEGKSLSIYLTGALTPCSFTSRCRVFKYNDIGFTITDPQQGN